MKKRNIFSRQAVNFLWVLLGLGAGLQFIEVIWAASKGYLGFFSMMVVIVTEMVMTGSIYVIIYKFLIKPCNETRKLFKHFIQSGSFQELIDQDYQIFPEQNEVMQKLDSILDKKNIIELSTKHAELLALQNQINPHFLYNTLDIIRWEAMYEAGGESRVTQMIEKFSQLCRMGMCAGGNTITLKEGIEHAKTYLEVLNFRHTEKIGLEIKCEAQENRLYMPQFILQPIMENSVIHGFEDGSHGFSIRIRAFCREEKLLHYVQDNGKGMDEQELELLRESMERTETEEGSIGLANVHQRIRLFYGEEYGLRINSRAEFGTEVEISLPVRYQSENMEGNREE